MGYDGNKDTRVTTDIIQEHPDVTFANEEIIKSNEKKIRIECHYIDNVSMEFQLIHLSQV